LINLPSPILRLSRAARDEDTLFLTGFRFAYAL